MVFFRDCIFYFSLIFIEVFLFLFKKFFSWNIRSSEFFLCAFTFLTLSFLSNKKHVRSFRVLSGSYWEKWAPDQAKLFVLYSTALRCGSFLVKNNEKKLLCRHDRNYYYFCKSNILVVNLIVGSRNMIKLSKHMSL